MSTTETGRAAEEAVAEYLDKRGYEILARNWRTRWHEVDIVASSPVGLHFIEVKYRHNPRYGSGFDYINRDKLQRLQRAALNWVQANHYRGDYQIDAVSVSGPPESLVIEVISNVVQG